MDVLMPQLGETVAEGKITQWYKAPGDRIEPGDNLFEIETDKTSMEVPATTAGVLAEVRAKVGRLSRSSPAAPGLPRRRQRQSRPWQPRLRVRGPPAARR
jgi:hypothetical protein